MKRLPHVLLIQLLIAASGSSLEARTWLVKPDGTGDAPTIQAGLDLATAGDTVMLACGVYREHNIQMKSGVCLRSQNDDPRCATIDAEQQGTVLKCPLTAPSTIIDGLTFTNGSASGMDIIGFGYGITVLNCVFSHNTSPFAGTAAAIEFSSATFQNCLFYDNYTSQGPGPNPAVCVAYFGATAVFSNCTFVDNSAGVSVTTDGIASLDNCILAYCRDGFTLGSDDSSYFASISCCDFFGNIDAHDDSMTVAADPSCFTADPQFCGVPGSRNYYIQSDSPCAPGNHPNGLNCGLIGALPVNCNEVPVRNRSWGFIKSIYEKSH
jgi:hypothetical protein